MVKEIIECGEIDKILAEEMGKEEGLQISVFELLKRIKINEHLANCNHPKCAELKIEQINKGLN